MLRKVVIKNFKSIDEAHLTLPRFGAIIGKNGSGKTNFISAIVLLKRLVDGITIEKARRQGLSFFTKEFFFMGGASNEAIFEFHFEAIDGSLFKYSFTIECTEEDNDFIISQESLYKNENIIFKRKSGNEGNVFDGKQIVPFSVDDGSLVLENYTNDSVAELRNLISNYTIVDAPVAGKNELQIVSIANLNLDTIDGVAVSLYVKNKELFDQAIESVKKIIPDFRGAELISLKVNENKVDTTSKQKEYLVTWLSSTEGQRYSHYSISHGDRKVIHLMLSLFNTSSRAFLVAEEIENGMHFGRLEKLIDQLRTQAYNLKIQLLFTTHSSLLLNDLRPSEVIYCRKNFKGATKIDLLTDTDEYKTVKDELSEADRTASSFVNAGFFD